MVLTLYNRGKGDSPYGEKYKSPTFWAGKPPWIKRTWWAIQRFFNMKIF